MFKVLILCLALGLAPQYSSANPLDGSDALVAESDAGHSLELAVNTEAYVFPFFRNLRSIDEKLGIQLKQDFQAAMIYMDRVVSQALVPVENGFRIRKRTLMHDLHAKGIAKTLRDLGDNNADLIPFVKMCSNFFHRLLKNARRFEQELVAKQVPFDAVGLQEYIHARISDFNLIFEQSPVAFLFDWEKGMIEGESAEQSLSKLMGMLRYHGHGKILTIVETFLTIILGVSKLG